MNDTGYNWRVHESQSGACNGIAKECLRGVDGAFEKAGQGYVANGRRWAVQGMGHSVQVSRDVTEGISR